MIITYQHMLINCNKHTILVRDVNGEGYYVLEQAVYGKSLYIYMYFLL